jgi:hypothetical protein
MASLEVTGDTLTVHITGLDRVLAFKHSITISLDHVVSVDRDVHEAGKSFHGLRLPGTSIPGVLTVGSFLRAGEWSFWDVHDPAKAAIIRLKDEHYGRLVVGVDDPIATIDVVQNALDARALT